MNIGLLFRSPAIALLAATALLGCVQSARAQSLTVLPVNIQMTPGQMATSLTVINRGDTETSIQVRGLAWSQVGGQETLLASDEIVVSPPIATIAAGGTQVVRLVLRHPSQGREATYRILVDQIPDVVTPGTVRIALRLSIPVFAQASSRTAPHLHFQIETDHGQAFLVSTNEGDRHEKLSQVVVLAGGARPVSVAADTSPYVLAGAVTRRRLAAHPGLLSPGATVRLTAQSDSGMVDQPVSVVAAR